MGVYLWVVDGMMCGIGRTADTARAAGIAALKESTQLVVSVRPAAAPLFDIEATVARGRALEFAYVGGTWPIPEIGPDDLLYRELTGAESIHTITTDGRHMPESATSGGVQPQPLTLAAPRPSDAAPPGPVTVLAPTPLSTGAPTPMVGLVNSAVNESSSATPVESGVTP